MTEIESAPDRSSDRHSRPRSPRSGPRRPCRETADLPSAGASPLPAVATCRDSGYRASAAASVLERLDFERVHAVPGSVSAWMGTGYPLEGGEADG